MIGFISSWAEQIIIAVIVVTILEMILPKGNSKKYIQTIMGVYILYTIISPAIKLFTGSDLKINYKDYEKYFGNMEVSSKVEGITVEDTYKSQIEKQMKIDIEKMGYEVTKLSFELDTQNWIIKGVDLSVSISNKEKNNNNNNSISVDKIEIGNKPIENTLSEKNIEEIKQMINENYGVDYTKITINSK